MNVLDAEMADQDAVNEIQIHPHHLGNNSQKRGRGRPSTRIRAPRRQGGSRANSIKMKGKGRGQSLPNEHE